ncbi:hypothetical protein DASC09_052340 [Saccharomycopsis crataegensis]|uniref:Uncharacterized protein n=1 Tax=Saccharomycopsis crataegensis TaxID=43959 RepID=A0AAV5QT16_9ASCO|nr:hypothetical protein DASC09_052340 [Saccharomycopsis crataegensis]
MLESANKNITKDVGSKMKGFDSIRDFQFPKHGDSKPETNNIRLMEEATDCPKNDGARRFSISSSSYSSSMFGRNSEAGSDTTTIQSLELTPSVSPRKVIYNNPSSPTTALRSKRQARHCRSKSEVISLQELEDIGLDVGTAKIIQKPPTAQRSYSHNHISTSHSNGRHTPRRFSLPVSYPIIDLEKGEYNNTRLDDNFHKSYKNFLDDDYTWKPFFNSPDIGDVGNVPVRKSSTRSNSFEAISEAEEEDTEENNEEETVAEDIFSSTQKMTFLEFLEHYG